jgi:hypothetical protein
MDEDITAAEIAHSIRAAASQHTNQWRAGQVRAGGRLAGFNIQLPNGQTFRIQVEEIES